MDGDGDRHELPGELREPGRHPRRRDRRGAPRRGGGARAPAASPPASRSCTARRRAPPSSPRSRPTCSRSRTADVAPVIEGVIQAEKGAIEHYLRIIEASTVSGPTQDMVIEILRDEESHLRTFERYPCEDREDGRGGASGAGRGRPRRGRTCLRMIRCSQELERLGPWPLAAAGGRSAPASRRAPDLLAVERRDLVRGVAAEGPTTRPRRRARRRRRPRAAERAWARVNPGRALAEVRGTRRSAAQAGVGRGVPGGAPSRRHPRSRLIRRSR